MTDFYALFGVEPPAESPEAVVDQEDNTETDGEKAQQVADAAQETAEQTDTDTEVTEQQTAEESGEAAQGGESKEPMSKQERAEQAKLRREREKQDAAAKAAKAAKEQAEREMAALIAGTGMKNRFRDNKPIQTVEDLKQWQEDSAFAQLQKAIRDGTATPEQFRKFAEQTAEPTAETLEEEQGKAAEDGEEEQSSEEAESDWTPPKEFLAQVQQELEEIKRLDPKVKSIADLKNLEGFEAEVGKGASFLEAFKAIRQRRSTEAARQEVLNSIQSKKHLKGTQASAGTAIVVPKKILENYKRFNPGMTDEQILADYAKRNNL